MKSLLSITASMIYLLIILFSVWIGLFKSRQRSGVDFQPIIAAVAGLTACPLMVLLVQFGQLSIPSDDIVLRMICLSLGIGFLVGLAYIWIVNLALDGSSEITNLFVFGSIAVSTICIYLFLFESQVQELLISLAWGFLMGSLLYVVLTGRVPGTSTQYSRPNDAKYSGRRTPIYLSIMILASSCLILGYGVFYFRLGMEKILPATSVDPSIIIVLGLGMAAINGISSNILADQLSTKVNTLPPVLKTGIPLTFFIVTLGLSIVLAIVNK